MSEEPKVNTISSDDRLWAALTYIFSPLVPIILLLLDDYKNRPYLRYHRLPGSCRGYCPRYPSSNTCHRYIWLWSDLMVDHVLLGI